MSASASNAAVALSKVFKAYDVRSVYPEPLNEELAWRIGCATGRFLSKNVKPTDTGNARAIAVTRDMRPSSPSMAAALIEGILASGLDVIDLGMCDTSFQYFAINHLGTAGGIQTTASHNPVQYNGFKISSVQARPIGSDSGLKEILAIAQTLGPRGSLPAKGKLTTLDLWAQYRKHVLSFYDFKAGARKLNVVIDASNGMAGKMVPAIFDGLPGLNIQKLNFEIGNGFAHDPNPLVAENMKPTQESVVKNKADIGACFDGDADRCILTDELGQIVNCDHLTAFLSGYFLKKSPGSGVAYDLRCSKSVPENVVANGGVPRRSRVGHVFMKQMLRDHNAVFGGEVSGHFYFRDNFYADSGAILFAVVLSILHETKEPLSKLIASYKKYPQSGEQNFHAEDKAAALAKVKETFGKFGKIDDLDGNTIDAWDNPAAGWWFNVRASNTEPLLRLNAEAKDQAKLDALLKQLQPMLGEPAHGH